MISGVLVCESSERASMLLCLRRGTVPKGLNVSMKQGVECPMIKDLVRVDRDGEHEERIRFDGGQRSSTDRSIVGVCRNASE